MSKLGPPAAACLLGAAPPLGADAAGPEFGAEISVEIEDVYVFAAQDQEQEQEINEASATVEGDFSLVFQAGYGVGATIVFEPVTDAERERYFRDFGLYAEELYLAGPVGGGEWRAGKVNLDFGLANDATSGLFDDEVAGDYELTERIGVAVEVPLAGLTARDMFSAAVFMADTTPLAESLFTRRDSLRRRDGGVSNSGAPESVSLGLSGASEGSAYSFGLRYQAAGSGDEADEYGGVLGLTRSIGPAGLDAFLLGEIAYFPRYDGDRQGAAFLTLGAEAGFGDLTLSGTYGLRRMGGSAVDHLVTLGLGLELADDLAVNLGYRFADEDGVASHGAGLQLTYSFDFP